MFFHHIRKMVTFLKHTIDETGNRISPKYGVKDLLNSLSTNINLYVYLQARCF